MKIAVLAVQGAFAEHIEKLRGLGADCVELRQRADLEQPFDGLILPGGESTVQGKLLRELHMLVPLRDRIRGGLPVLATCAGLILLAQEIGNDDAVWFGTLPVRVQRNAYGRQLGSFRTEQEMRGIGRVPMTFIRAPYVESVLAPQSAEKFEARENGSGEPITGADNFVQRKGGDTADGECIAVEMPQILARVDGRIVAVRYRNQIGLSFHPELDGDDRIHEMFLRLCEEESYVNL